MRSIRWICIKVLLATAALLVATCIGCASIKRPKAVELTKSQYSDYPYRFVIRATEVIRFNVHQLTPDYAEDKFVRYLFLKRRTGIFNETDFALNFVDEPISAIRTRGTLKINEGAMVVSVEVAVEDSPVDHTPTKYRAFELNGQYEILDKTGESNTSSTPTLSKKPAG